jgi:hypothetical protein
VGRLHITFAYVYRVPLLPSAANWLLLSAHCGSYWPHEDSSAELNPDLGVQVSVHVPLDVVLSYRSLDDPMPVREGSYMSNTKKKKKQTLCDF